MSKYAYAFKKDILANIDMSTRYLADHHPTAPADGGESMSQITQEASRGHLLVDEFLRFVRTDAPVVSSINPNKLLDDLLAFLHKELQRRNIHVTRDYQEGLPICRTILNQLDGALRVESPPGQGPAFTVELPCRMGKPS